MPGSNGAEHNFFLSLLSNQTENIDDLQRSMFILTASIHTRTPWNSILKVLAEGGGGLFAT